MADPTQHPAYGAARWLLVHGGALLPVALALCVLGVLAGTASLWFLQGARLLAAVWVWWRAWAWWRSCSGPSPDRPGGAGGHREPSDRYRRVMASPGWRRRRAQTIRRAGRRCQACGRRGPLDVHHLSYAHLGDERPDELIALCGPCHSRLHGRLR